MKPALKLGSVGVNINLIDTVIAIPDDAQLSVRCKRPDGEYFELTPVRTGEKSARVVTTAEHFAPDKFNCAGKYGLELSVNGMLSETGYLIVREL